MPFEQLFDLGDIDRVAEVPGLYAWYGVPPRSPLDLETASHTREWLARATRRVAAPPLDVDARGRLGASWEGTVSDASLAILLQSILGQMRFDGETSESLEEGDEDTVGDTEQRRTALDQTLLTDNLRQRMATILHQSAPVFASPLYVGMSMTLQSRLSAHRRDIYDFYGHAQQSASDRETLQTHTRFGARAVGHGFSSESLRVYVHQMPELTEVPAAECRRLLLAVEWLLNRWYRPLLGMR